MLVHAMPKLEARRQAKLHSIMLSVKASARRAVWKLPSETKVDGGGDSRTRRTTKCACCKSVADAGKTHLPGQAKRAARLVEQAWVSLTRRSTGDSWADSRWAKGCGASAGERSRERVRACFDRKVGDQTSGRRPGFGYAVVLTPRQQARVLAGRGLWSRARSARFHPCPATEDVRGLVRPVRLPQPMGAGGQQPLRSQPLPRGVDSTLRRPGQAEAITVKIRAIWSASGPLREMRIRPPETDPIRLMPRRRRARPCGARLG